jgi:hypothetical protein
MNKTPSASVLSLGALALLVAATASFMGLSKFSKPENFANRVALLDERMVEIRRLSRSSKMARDYVPGSLCPSIADEELAGFASALQARATQLNLSTVMLSVSPAEAVGETAAKVSFQSEFSGPYEGASALLADLANQTPRVFVDRIDLMDKAATVSLRFSGHFYCSTAA